MPPEPDLESLRPDRVFDGGTLDCGAGLILLIRRNMLEVPEQGILEMRSREPSVRDELPPWCRMAGHTLLGNLPGKHTGETRYFLQRGSSAADESRAFEEDKQKARDYAWRLRARLTAPLETTVYCRNFSFQAGQPASFEEKDRRPSALEYLLGALAADLTCGFSAAAAQAGLEIDELEISVSAKLHNILAHLGLEHGDPSLASVELTCFASSVSDAKAVRTAWEITLQRSPLYTTLSKVTEINARLSLV
ncbi:MAG TPA: OsmC family protein [Verrucomicrobiales bacterium]|nr:OsmC family protein [Verrucomicrobiales bacterium]